MKIICIYPTAVAHSAGTSYYYHTYLKSCNLHAVMKKKLLLHAKLEAPTLWTSHLIGVVSSGSCENILGRESEACEGQFTWALFPSFSSSHILIFRIFLSHFWGQSADFVHIIPCLCSWDPVIGADCAQSYTSYSLQTQDGNLSAPFNNQEGMQGFTQQQWLYFVLTVCLMKKRNKQIYLFTYL